jgi:hypothetical protein
LLAVNSDYPGSIIEEYINIEYEIQKLNTGTFSDSQVNSKLWNSYRGKMKALRDARKVDLCFKIMGEYASALEKLSSPKIYEDLSEPSDKLGTNIDTLIKEFNSINNKKIPLGIGKLISKGLTTMGRTYVKNKQTQELKKYILEGETLVNLTSENIRINLDTVVLKQWIPGLIDDLKIRQENLLSNLNPKGEYKVYYANEFNKEVADIIIRIDNLEQFTRKTITSVNKLNAAHHELLQNLENRKKIKEVLKETQELFVSTREIVAFYKSIKQAKTNLSE